MIKHRNGTPFTDRRDHYQEVTDKIVAALENGTKPWQQPWKSGSPGMPVNGATGRRYHGINVLLLAMTSFALGGDPRFCSYKQAADRGWQVRKGERGTTVLFFKRMLVEDRDAAPDAEDRTKAIPMLRAVHGVQRRADRRYPGLRRAQCDRSAVASPGGGRHHPDQQQGCHSDRR